MAFFDDQSLLNDAASSGDWTANDYDSPTTNDSSATTPIYIEGSACAWWPLKKGITNGYTYTSTITGTPSLTGRVCVGWLNYPYADIDLIPINDMFIRISSSTGFTTNYGQWDAKAQILAPKNIPISGHTPVMVYPTNPDSSNGTPNYGAIESVGWVATTGNDADGKQGGFDMFHIIGYMGGHSATYTNTFFSGLYTHGTPTAIPGTTNKPYGVFSKSGDFYQTNVNIRLGHGTSDTANIIVTETNKTVFFNNVEPEHELGYEFVNPSGGNQLQINLIGVNHFWNDQPSTAEIFGDANNADKFIVDGCSYARGGKATLPDYISDTLSYVKNSKFDDCHPVNLTDQIFENNVISNATVGALISGTGTRRFKNNSFTGCSDALHFDTAQTITVEGDQFNNNTYDVHFSGTGTLTINAVNGTNISTSRVSGGGTVVISQSYTHTVVDLDSGSRVVWIRVSDGVELENKVEVSGSADYTHGGGNVPVYVQILDLNKTNKIVSVTLGNASSTLPASQADDRVYLNPA